MIDFRSDTVTKPTPAMLEAMINAPVGDDVYGEDPTVNNLEKLAAEMLGKEAAVFAASGTQSNLIGLLSHCQRGDEYIVGQHAHTYKYEGGGAAVLGSIQPQPLDLSNDGTFDLDKVKSSIKPDDFHFARTRLLCIENSHNGLALPMDYIEQLQPFAQQNGLNLHLDGARLFNAAVKHEVSAAKLAAPFDSISICLSKGLGAPVGSVLCGKREIIAEARKWRKMVGGGMRQAGILAAAGIHALENHVKRLAEDHQNAEKLAEGLAEIEEITVEIQPAQTNMVFIQVGEEGEEELPTFLQSKEISISDGRRIRLVTHLNISSGDIDKAVHAFKEFYTR